MTDEQNERAARVWREAYRVFSNCAFADTDAPDEAATAVIAREFEALEAENARLREALKPFAFLEMEKDEGLADTQYVWEVIYSDRVRDWFSFNDIDSARAALGASHDADA